MARLADVFDEIYIDEVQDLAGYDLDLLERLLTTHVETTLVGDTRQATYSTNHAARNGQFRGTNMLRLFERWQQRDLCRIDHQTMSWRCMQSLCDLADSLYPDMPRTQSGNDAASGHDGIFVVSPDAVDRYVREFSPRVLRYDRNENCGGLPAVNFGESKGRTYARVLIFPNGPLTRFLLSGDPARISSPAKESLNKSFANGHPDVRENARWLSQDLGIVEASVAAHRRFWLLAQRIARITDIPRLQEPAIFVASATDWTARIASGPGRCSWPDP